MARAILPLLLMLLCFAAAPQMSAGEPPQSAQDEIQHLLKYLGRADCEFLRNGAWHSAGEARDHIARKYRYLLKKDLVKTSEDFIRLAATNSSASGTAYQVRCADHDAVPSAVWLTEELARYRDANRGKKE